MNKQLLSSGYLTCQVSDTLLKILSHMRDTGIQEVLCYDKKRFVGMLDRHQIHSIRSSASSKVKKYVKSVKKLSLKHKEKEVAQALLDCGVHSLPVFDKSKLLGVVHAYDLVPKLGSASFMKQKVSTIGSLRPLFFHESTRLDKALALLRRHHVDHAPLIDEHLRLTGVVSLSDLEAYFAVPQQKVGGRGMRLPRSHTQRKTSSGSVEIGNFSKRQVISLAPTGTVRSAFTLMKKNLISSIILTERKDLVGIITLTDILRALLKA